MSKRELKKYLATLTKEQLEEQLVNAYEKFADVKTYYNFVFNPKEDKLASDAKAKIKNEYFPVKSKRARLRRSIAQKFIKHFRTLGVEPHTVADVMFFSIEVAQQYSAQRTPKYESFFKSIQRSFEEAVAFTVSNGIDADFRTRANEIAAQAERQHWENRSQFLAIVQQL